MRDRKAQVEDEDLVLRSQDGEAQAFRALVSRWQERLWRHAARRTGHGDAAWDVVQESWIGIIRALPRLDDPGSFPSWAYRIVTRRAADWVRGKARWSRVARDLLREAPRDGTGNGPDETRRDDIDALRQALSRLDPERRAILSLHYLEGCSVEEVARILEVPPGTVKSRLFHC